MELFFLFQKLTSVLRFHSILAIIQVVSLYLQFDHNSRRNHQNHFNYRHPYYLFLLLIDHFHLNIHHPFMNHLLHFRINYHLILNFFLFHHLHHVNHILLMNYLNHIHQYNHHNLHFLHPIHLQQDLNFVILFLYHCFSLLDHYLYYFHYC